MYLYHCDILRLKTRIYVGRPHSERQQQNVFLEPASPDFAWECVSARY